MKKLMTLLCCITCTACAPPRTAFVQGNIRIVPPAKHETDEAGIRISYMVNDGGSRGYNIVDSLGHKFQVRFDHSFIIENGKVIGNKPGTIYVSSPETDGLVKILDQEGFRRIILKKTE